MRTRITAAVLAVLVGMVCLVSPALAGEGAVCSFDESGRSGPSGMKADESEDRAGEIAAVPASSPWGMWVMIMLILMASTAAMMGNGARFRFSEPSPVAAPAEPRSDPEPELRAPRAVPNAHSPKNKSKRPFSQRRASRAQFKSEARRARNLARTRRRREGPGCRGIR